VATAIELGDFAIQVGAGLALGLALHGLGQYREAVKVLQGNVSLLQGERRYGRFGTAGTTSVNSIMVLAWCHAELGSFAEGAAVSEEGLRIARVTDHPLSLVFAELGVGHLYVLQGDLVRAIPALERATAACRKWDFPSLLPLVASLLGAAYALAGRAGDALPLLEQSVAQASSIGWKADSSRQAARLGLGYMAAGRMKDAFALASRALDHAVEQKSQGHEAWALHLLGEIVFRSDPRDPERAEVYYRKALLLAEELGMRPLAAHCQLGLGRTYERTGKVGEAQQALASAREMHREMDMQFWLQRRGG